MIVIAAVRPATDLRDRPPRAAAQRTLRQADQRDQAGQDYRKSPGDAVPGEIDDPVIADNRDVKRMLPLLQPLSQLNRELVRLPGPDRRDFWHAWSAFSPDGELLVACYHLTGSEGVLLRIWHLDRRELLGSLPSREGLAFHSDGRRLLFGAMEGGIAVWDYVERRVVQRLALDFPPRGLAIDPEGRRLAVNMYAASAPRAMIIELQTGRVLAKWTSQVGLSAMAWSADGQLLAVGGSQDDPRVYVWNVRRRLIYWYRQLNALEKSLDDGAAKYAPVTAQSEIDRIDAGVRRIRMPNYFSDQLYDLRGHIDLVRQRLMARPASVPAE